MPVLTNPLGWFTLRVPEGWHPSTEDGVTTLTSPYGGGVLYLSGGRHVGGRQAEFGGAEFLARFLRFLGLGVEDDAIEGPSGASCRIYEYRREEEGIRWRYWSVTDDETALLICYICGAGTTGREPREVEEIVRSVQLFHSAVH